MYDEVEDFLNAIDNFKKAQKNRNNDPDGYVGEDSATWAALSRAQNALRDKFRRAVLSVLGN